MRNYVKTILNATSILLFLSACTGGPSPSKEPKVDKTLPKPSLNGYLSDMTSAAFEWKPVTDSRVEGFVVYRNNPKAKEPASLLQIDTIKSADVTHYLDEGLTPGTLYRYRFATYAADRSVSIASEQLEVRTKPLLASVSFFSTSGSMPRSAKLVWRPHTDNCVVAYNLERRQGGAESWRKVATIKGRLNAEYIDKGLDDNTRYEYRLRSVTHNGIVSLPSDTIAVITKALPKPINTISASQGKAGVIEVSWSAGENAKVSYYRLYRATSSNGRYSEIADKIMTTRYSDRISEPSQQYYYKVVAVSPDGLAGEPDAANSALGTTIDAPNAPKELVAMIENSTVQLTWAPSDSRTIAYVVIKKSDKGFFSSETKEFTNIKKTLMIDSSLKKGEDYSFSVIGVDKNGIRSAPSNSVNVKLEDNK